MMWIPGLEGRDLVPSQDVLASDKNQARPPAPGSRLGSSADVCHYSSVHGSLLVGVSPLVVWIPT
eukprot:10058723-Prorocentrum_lima.AAC.1